MLLHVSVDNASLYMICESPTISRSLNHFNWDWSVIIIIKGGCTGGCASPDGWAVWGVVLSTRWWLLIDHCVLRNWDRILVRAVKGLISRAGMVSICPLLWQRDVKLQQTKLKGGCTGGCEHMQRNENDFMPPFGPPLCTLFRLNCGKQAQGAMRWN